MFGLSCTFGFDVSRNQFQESQESLAFCPAVPGNTLFAELDQVGVGLNFSISAL